MINFKMEKKPVASLIYVFCSDKDVLEINQLFLKHNYYTDIISFNLAAKNAPVEGEIYISLDRVKDNALRLNQYSYVELHRVIFHDALNRKQLLLKRRFAEKKISRLRKLQIRI